MPASSPCRACIAAAVRLALPVAAALAVGGCASSGPAVHLHTLMPAEIPARAAAAAPGGGPLAIALEVRLPAQVDQPQLLVRLPDDSLMSLEQERWASPLRDEMRQALLEQLGAVSNVVESRSATVPAAMRVNVDLRRFDSLPGREARIEGAWLLAAGSGAGTPTRCDFVYRVPAAGAAAALVAAHRQAIVRLADAIGAGVAASARGGQVDCPASDRR